MYGKEVILDLHNCNTNLFSRSCIGNFFDKLCTFLGMEQCDVHFWDYSGEQEEYDKAPDHLKGISAIQFITTSNITIHTLDVLKQVHINVFSCAEFNSDSVKEFCEEWWQGEVVNYTVTGRV